MAQNSISIVAPEDNSVSLVFMPNGVTPSVSSKTIAFRFQKKHKDVLRDIDRIRSMVPKDFYERNFAPIEIGVVLPHSGGIRKDPAYLLSRDAFSLLAMGFTGKAAIQWKLRYIEAFNSLEAAALERVKTKALQDAFALRQRLTPTRRAQMRRALRYRGMGLEYREIGKLMDCSHQMVFYLIKDAGMLNLAGEGV